MKFKNSLLLKTQFLLLICVAALTIGGQFTYAGVASEIEGNSDPEITKTEGLPVSDFLDEEGNFRNPEGYSGAIDLSGFTMDLSVTEAPVFKMSSADPNDDWHAIGDGVGNQVNALAVIGNNLFIVGSFTTAGGAGANRIVRFNLNTGTWHPLGSGMNDYITAIAVHGDNLYVGGVFTEAGGAGANRIARYDLNTGSWHALGDGVTGSIITLLVHGDNLYVGGLFSSAGGSGANRIARYDLSNPNNLDNNDNWHALGVGLNSRVSVLKVHGDNLYVGGFFTSAGGSGANRIARYDLNAGSWHALGDGVTGPSFFTGISAIAEYDNNLYVGGAFTSAGGSGANNIALYDLSDSNNLDSNDNWHALGEGLDGDVYTLKVHGDNLYVGGEFQTAGGSGANYIARYDLSDSNNLNNNTNWHTLGDGLNNRIYTLAVFGQNLYVGGNFTEAGGKPATRFARWAGLVAKPGTVTLSSPGSGTTDIALQHSFSWGTVSDATTYELQVSASQVFSGTVINQSGLTSTSFAPTNTLDRATTYYWRVRGDNSGVKGDWSTTRSFTTIPNVPPQLVLSAPAAAATNTALRPDFSWAAATGAGTYQIQVSTAANLSSLVIDQSGMSATTFTPTSDLGTSSTYYWRARAVNAGGNGPWSTARSFTTIPNAPEQVSLSEPTEGAPNTVLKPELSWGAASNASTYDLQVSVQSDLSRAGIDLSGLTSTTFTPATDLSRATIYYWRVRAVNAVGNGPWSTTRNFTTIPNVPAQVALSGPAEGATNATLQPQLSWAAANGAGNYEIQIASDAGFSSLAYSQTSLGATALTHSPATSLSRATTYHWRVRGVNPGGNGPWSGARSFTTIPEIPAQVVLSSPGLGEELADEDLSPQFIWQQATGADHYLLELSTGADANFDVGVLYSSDPISETSFSLPELVELEYSTTYYWRVWGVNDGGNGPTGEIRGFTTGSVAPPQSMQLTIGPDGQIQITWDGSGSSPRIEFFDIFCGPAPWNLEFCERVDADQFDFNSQGSVVAKGSNLTSLQSEYFAVQAVINEDLKSALSEVVNIVEISGQIPDQWSLISLPVDDAGVEVESSALFSFSKNNYVRETLLAPGRAYWARSDAQESYTRRAPGLTRTSLELVSGWNMLGGLVAEVAVADIADPDSVLGVTPVYSWSGDEYVPADTLAPFEGYWIFADEPGTIELRLQAEVAGQSGDASAVAANSLAGPESADNKLANTLDPQKLVITAADQSRSLQLFPQGLPGESGHWLLPPRGPAERMDLRTGDGLSALGSPSQSIELSGGQWPLTVMVSGQGEPDYGWVLSGQSGPDRVQVNLLPDEAVQLTLPMEDLHLEHVHRDEMIFETELMSGYPNPFNPSVNLRYRLAQAEDVTMQIYDIAGRRVATLVNARQQPGSYTVQFNGSSLASGIYFVRLRSGSTLAVQKISLIK